MCVCVCVCVCVCGWVGGCVCVCVCERERDRDEFAGFTLEGVAESELSRIVEDELTAHAIHELENSVNSDSSS